MHAHTFAMQVPCDSQQMDYPYSSLIRTCCRKWHKDQWNEDDRSNDKWEKGKRRKPYIFHLDIVNAYNLLLSWEPMLFGNNLCIYVYVMMIGSLLKIYWYLCTSILENDKVWEKNDRQERIWPWQGEKDVHKSPLIVHCSPQNIIITPVILPFFQAYCVCVDMYVWVCVVRARAGY